MRIEEANTDTAKGWFYGPWDAALDLSIGYANEGVDDPHLHRAMTEIYLMASGTAEMRIETETVLLSKGQIVIIAPGEAHTFLSSSPDHFHFVVQHPGMRAQAARDDKVLVPRSRLGL
jgi:mannose-6-phosphate isomerase-like protein (cupin superfamily)